MQLRPETQDVLRDVEELTGAPVEIIEDADQPHLARITRARAGVPYHLLRVNPTLGEPDYLVVYECGFILRMYQTPPEQRREFEGADRGRTEAERLVRHAGQLAGLPEAAKAQLTQQLLDGILTQLRSYPIGIRIDHWIAETFPDLRSLQGDAVSRQQQDNLKVLAPELRATFPKPIYEANVAMNAAYAIFCDREFGKAGFAIPYRSAGYDRRGRALLDLVRTLPADPPHDRSLVDGWAEQLGLQGWYQWVPLRP
jgi:hypothetical protein